MDNDTPFTTYNTALELDGPITGRSMPDHSLGDFVSSVSNQVHDTRLILNPNIIARLEDLLSQVDHNPIDAAAGWRSNNPFVTASLFAMFGYLTFPCDKAKIPLTNRGFYNATSNLAIMSYWQRVKSAHGWCIRTGRYEGTDGPPGMWIMDVDDAEGYAWLATLEKRHGTLPPTWTNMSGREGGGEHRMFAPAASGPDMKTVAHALIMGERGKIDQKGRGGYAVIAGSYHSTGKRYRWAEGRAPDEVALAELPPAWLEAMDKAGEQAPKSSTTHSPKIEKSRTDATRQSEKRSVILGDGPGGGGFHDPINGLAIKYFLTAGPHVDSGKLLALLREHIAAAPKMPGRDVSRYLSAQYLTDAIERARTFARNILNDK